MSYNFRPVERDQQFLMPPSLRDWLPADHLAWFVLDAVEQIDLGPIVARYRADGWGAPAFDPAMMTALLLYAYAVGERSSRRIEAACRADVAYRVITANQAPDHATIARFRADHEVALAGLFGEILRLCRVAGLARLGLVALDGTKIGADASRFANHPADELDLEIARILAEAAAADAAEDAAFGRGRRGDELPPELAERGSRLARLLEARRQIDADEAARTERHAARVAERAALPAAERMQVRPPTKPPRTRRPQGNATDPDSRRMRDFRQGVLQAYNAQAMVSEDGIVVAAEVSSEASDALLLAPMLEAARTTLAAAGVTEPIGMLLADGGYWSEAEVTHLPPGTPELLIAPTVGQPRRPGPRRSFRYPTPAKDAMRQRLASERGRALYRRRSTIVEPLFGDLKENRRFRRFRRRGQTAAWSEWRLTCATGDLLKLWRARRRPFSPLVDGQPRRPPPLALLAATRFTQR